MKRINVIGTTGSGKSTFSKALADNLEIPYIQLDELFWKQGWTESSDDELFSKLEASMSAEAWVLDGNYSRTNELKWSRTDTVVWLDYGFVRTFLQLLKRTLKRSLSNEELWPGTGNRESFTRSFLSKDSILVWFLRTYFGNRTSNKEILESPALGHIRMVRLASPREAERFLNDASLEPDYSGPSH